jgi:membrane-bound metal-dependent hydrolase YbcI (DUF457 family)
MRYYTHAALGASLGYITARVAGIPPVYTIPAAAFGAVVPDIDHPNSWISKRIPLWPHLLESIQGDKKGALSHRGVVHSIYGFFAFALIASIIFALFARGYYAVLFALNLGYFSHLYLSDIFFDGGVHLFSLKRRVKLPTTHTFFKTGSTAEIVILVTLLFIPIIIPQLKYILVKDAWLTYLPIIVSSLIILLFIAFAAIRTKARMDKAERCVTYSMELPRDDETTLEAATNMFSALHGLRATWYKRVFNPQAHLTFEILGKKDISFHVTIPDERDLPRRVKNTIQGIYPNIRMKRIDEVDIDTSKRTAMCQLKQVRHPVFALKSTQFEEGEDPIEAITNALSDTPPGETRVVQILVKPSGRSWQRKARMIRNRVREKSNLNISKVPGSWLLSDFFSVLGGILSDVVVPPPQNTTEDHTKMISTAIIPDEIKEFGMEADAKLNRNCYRSEIRLIVQSEGCRYHHVEALADAFKIHDSFNRLKKNRVWPWTRSIFLNMAKKRLYPIWGSRTILDAQELGSIFHPPGVMVETRGLRKSFQREKEASVHIPSEGRIIGISVDRGNERPVAISRVDEGTHIIGFGRTGMGKTEWIKNLIHEGLRDGCGGLYIDPHGEAAKQLLGQVDDCFLHRVLYWAPWDEEHALGFNVLEKSADIISANEKSLIVESTIDVFESTWKITDIMVRLKHYLRYGLQTLVEYPGPMTILELRPLYLDVDFRRNILSKIENPEILEFWRDEWDRLQERQRFDFIMSLLDRLSSISLDNRMKHITGQDNSQIDFVDLMDEGKFLIVDLDMSKMGESNAPLLGTLLVSKIFQASMGRKDRDRLFRMYIDEAQNFMTYTYAKVLSQSRKFGICQYLWVQYLEQLTPEVLSAVLGNVGTYVCLRAGIEDAKLVAPYFSRTQLREEVDKTVEDIINLDPYHALVKTSTNKESLPPFKMKSLPMLQEGDQAQAEFLIESTFHFHCKGVKTREEIDAQISRRRNFDSDNGKKKGGGDKGAAAVDVSVAGPEKDDDNGGGGGNGKKKGNKKGKKFEGLGGRKL